MSTVTCLRVVPGRLANLQVRPGVILETNDTQTTEISSSVEKMAALGDVFYIIAKPLSSLSPQTPPQAPPPGFENGCWRGRDRTGNLQLMIV